MASSWQAISSRSRLALDIPKAQVLEDLFHELLILDKRNYFHRPKTLRALPALNTDVTLYRRIG